MPVEIETNIIDEQIRAAGKAYLVEVEAKARALRDARDKIVAEKGAKIIRSREIKKDIADAEAAAEVGKQKLSLVREIVTGNYRYTSMPEAHNYEAAKEQFVVKGRNSSGETEQLVSYVYFKDSRSGSGGGFHSGFVTGDTAVGYNRIVGGESRGSDSDKKARVLAVDAVLRNIYTRAGISIRQRPQSR